MIAFYFTVILLAILIWVCLSFVYNRRFYTLVDKIFKGIFAEDETEKEVDEE